MLELPPGSPQHAPPTLLLHLLRSVQGVAAARVGEHPWEGDLLSGALLQEQSAAGVKQEHAEGSVEEASCNIGVEVTVLLGASAQHPVL